MAQGWIDAGLTPAQASAYIEAGCWDADAVAALIAVGVTPEHLGDEDVLARVVVARGGNPDADDYDVAAYVTDGSLAYAVSNADLSAAQIAAALAPTEPTVRCACGEWSGELCQWSGPESSTVLVEYMPEQHRASHDEARNRGAYQANGARRVRVERSCADGMVEHDGKWCEIVE